MDAKNTMNDTRKCELRMINLGYIDTDL